MQEYGKCPIWGTRAKIINDSGKIKHVISLRSGVEYYIRYDAESHLKSLYPKDKARLTTWLINKKNNSPDKIPEITTSVLEEVKRMPFLSIKERLNRLTLLLYSKTEGTLSKKINIYYKNEDDCCLFEELCAHAEIFEKNTADTKKEIQKLLEFLKERKYIEIQYSKDHTSNVLESVSFLVEGVEKAEKLLKDKQKTPFYNI